jgi:ribosomal protein S12 methylthiotransferase
MAHTDDTPSVFLLSLGCPKNRVDSEVMLGSLGQQGFDVAGSAEDADVLVVNTCAFIGPAKEESVDAILALAKVKAEGEGKKLVVTGCLAQRYGQELAEEIPEVDHFLGTGAFLEIGRVLRRTGRGDGVDAPARALIPDPDHVYDAATPRVRSTRGGFSYLKVAEGCDNACAFCIIPTLRGGQKSRPVDDLVAEAAALSASGVKELNLIAQDLTAYGHDLPGKPHLADLLDALSAVDGLRWIRMLYAYPRVLPEKFFEVCASREKVVPYLDMPLQHASDRVLRIMRRGRDVAFVRRQVAELRERIGGPRGGLTFRTTFIVGHPGETEDDFHRLRDFLEEMRFERVGVFAYSDEEGTPAFDLPDKVPPEVGEARRAELMDLQRKISAEHQQAMVGRRLEVLVEGVSEESELLLQGRHAGQAPEIDGVVFINRGEAAPGDMVEVEVSAAADYDLVGGIPGDWGYSPEGADPRPASGLKVVG